MSYKVGTRLNDRVLEEVFSREEHDNSKFSFFKVKFNADFVEKPHFPLCKIEVLFEFKSTEERVRVCAVANL